MSSTLGIKRRCMTQKNNVEEYEFYMRELQRNLIYCHQKQKAKRRRTFSLNQAIAVVQKSTKHTAIDYEQVDFQHISKVSCKPTNGSQLFTLIEGLRHKKNQQLKADSSSRLIKELDSKLKIFTNTLQQKKLKKKQAERFIKQNNSYSKYYNFSQKIMFSQFSTPSKRNILTNTPTLKQLENNFMVYENFGFPTYEQLRPRNVKKLKRQFF